MQSKDALYTWDGRFDEPMTELVQRYTASIPFDHRLWRHDIQGSLAHATMLAEQGIISQEDARAIHDGLQTIAEEIRQGQFNWSLALEDIHLNIEKRLTDLIGEAGKKLHTGRSRNDQVATDLRLFVREAIDDIDRQLQQLLQVLCDLARQEAASPMPGFTHLQVAQPITVGHHLLAYAEMFLRDKQRFADCRRRTNVLPLGAAALAGTTFTIDRHLVAQILGFDDIAYNSLDAVADRDFAIEFCAAASTTMMHISRLSEELVLWMSQAFNFIKISDGYCTGSSIMPQKKNPDVPELARGKTGRVYGHLQSLLVLMKGQPLAYNKDNQEDKEPLFDTVDTVVDTLRIFVAMLPEIQFNHQAMAKALHSGFATATDLADYLVRKGLAFRDAHRIVGIAVKHAERCGCDLADLDIAYFKTLDPAFEQDVAAALTLAGALAARNHVGGTAPAQVQAAAARILSRIDQPRL